MADIQLESVTRRFPDGTVAVDRISLEIKDGEFMIIVGPSGSGKSTLLRMIVGLEDITAGAIRIHDQDVTTKAPRDRNLAMVFQDYALYPHLTVRENMEFPLKLRKTTKEERKERIDRAAKTLEIEDLLDRKPAQLSGGQRQRVAMGRAIVRDPAAFLLDEPLSNLDAKLRLQVRGELADLQRRLQATMVYVTHDQVEAMTLGDRVAVLRRGVLQQVATPKELYLSPSNIFVAGFIGSPAMNFFPARVENGRVRLPMVEYDLPEHIRPRARVLESRRVTAGIRPEHFEDIALVGRAQRAEGIRFTARVDRLEWLGSELFVYFKVTRQGAREGASTGLREIASELREAGVREEEEEQTVARIDPASEVAEGDDAEFWIDINRVYYFDADTGENLLHIEDQMSEAEQREAGHVANEPEESTARTQ
ncbi:MAG: sn-glycerol-3-phosphate ABC transporter ATP-binding protein UgpC [Actinomycetota bacterium]|jgi:multiple sugar transport system ATP-binding protein|nr:sn-glycerol-3-phosphate ABC transporter ATP-binding protein UgpC [Actinomycetota bacterium]